jgi:hypothetical protein
LVDSSNTDLSVFMQAMLTGFAEGKNKALAIGSQLYGERFTEMYADMATRELLCKDGMVMTTIFDSKVVGAVQEQMRLQDEMLATFGNLTVVEVGVQPADACVVQHMCDIFAAASVIQSIT